MLRVMSALMLLIVTSPLWATTEARLVKQSSSGQTVMFNLGRYDGIVEGDYAVIAKQIVSMKEKDLRIVPVAKARNIKVNTDNSIWVLYHTYDSELLVNDQKFIVLTESNMLNGRRDPKVRRLDIVSKKGETRARLVDALKDDQDRLSKLSDKYVPLATTKEGQQKSDADFELIDLEEWEKVQGDRYRVALYKSPHKEEFRRSYRIETFQNMVAAYLKRVNDPDFNYDDFYDEQMRSEFSIEFRKKSSMPNEYEKFLRHQASRATADAKLYRSLLEKGETWSEDFSDEELRMVLNNVSYLQESDRRKVVLSRPNRYAVFFEYGQHILDQQTGDDPLYTRKSRYSLETEFEVIPFLKHETLERFSLTASFRNNQNAFQASGYNADLDEKSVSAGINWYPVYSPYTIETPLFYLGLYARTGIGSARVPTLNQEANYNLFSVPGFRTGFKYNLRNKLGLRIGASMETLKLQQYDTNKLGSTLPEDVNLVEGKVGIAMAYSF